MMSELELISEAPMTAQDSGAETRRKALFLVDKVYGMELRTIQTILDYHQENEPEWIDYIEVHFTRVEREANLRGESWEWRDA
jgi:hypothetical protein